MFKIGELVRYTDGRGRSTAARVEGLAEARRWRICIPSTGNRLTVPAGDIAHVGEDEARIMCEDSAEEWHTMGGLAQIFDTEGWHSPQRPDGNGNYVTVPDAPQEFPE